MYVEHYLKAIYDKITRFIKEDTHADEMELQGLHEEGKTP